MKHGICIEFRDTEARLVVASRRGGDLVIQCDETIRWNNGDVKDRGEELAAVLASHKLAKSPAVIAYARDQLAWQTYQLPPAPAADLADLVHLQAARDLSTDDQATLDFLALEGDDTQPYRVLTVADRQARLLQTRAICSAAGIEAAAATPLELGWPSVVEGDQATDECYGVAIARGQAIIWMFRHGGLRRLRTCRLPSGTGQVASKVLAGELRRTALADSQTPAPEASWLLLVDASTEPIAAEVLPTLEGRVEVRLLSPQADIGNQGVALTTDNAAHAALAADLASQRKPAIDLLHPRERPEPPSRLRTYLLAAAAILAAAGALFWQGYQNLRAPLLAAESAQQELAQLEPMVEAMAADVALRDRVAQWRASAPNLLEQLALFSRQLRPTPLDSEAFAENKDAMLTRLMQTGDAYTLTTAIKDAGAAALVERRLRDARRRVVRQRLEALDGGPEGYQQQLVIGVEPDANAPGPAAEDVEDAL